MKYRFSDIHNEEMYSTAHVLIIAGQYSLFNNIVTDKLKKLCRGEIDLSNDSSLLGEFGLTKNDTADSGSYIDFPTFLEVSKIPSITGKWYCNVDYKMLNKRQRDQFERYIKKPNPYGVLVVTLTDFQDYRPMIRNRLFLQHPNTHLIQLSFPYRKSLETIAKEMFEKNHVTVGSKALELFIMRMGKSYEEYDTVISRISVHYKNKTIEYKEMREALQGVDNYVLDDFLAEIVNPIKSKKIVTSRKIYKMAGVLIGDMGARKLVNSVIRKVNDIIELRLLINNGVIPIKIGFSVTEVKDRLSEENQIKKMNDFTLRRYAELASKTSLKDWVYIKLILSNVSNTWEDYEYEKAIFAMIHRNLLSSSRLSDDMGLSSIMEEQLYNINALYFTGVRHQ